MPVNRKRTVGFGERLMDGVEGGALALGRLLSVVVVAAGVGMPGRGKGVESASCQGADEPGWLRDEAGLLLLALEGKWRGEVGLSVSEGIVVQDRRRVVVIGLQSVTRVGAEQVQFISIVSVVGTTIHHGNVGRWD
jgi:hypothetical protein